MLSRWQLDLLLSGWAIAHKGRTLKKEWSEHIQRTKEFLIKSLAGGEEVHVLGAGRLLDFPLNEIKEKYRSIHFYDGDPGAVRYLRSLETKFKNIQTHSVDLTDGLSDFKTAIKKLNRIEDLSSTEFSKLTITKEINFSSKSQIVSLNLLSQLPLAYREILERWILKKYGSKYLKDSESSWLAEYNILGSRVVTSHLELLAKTDAKKLILITDTEQLFYPVTAHQIPAPKETSFLWEVNSKIKHPLEVTSSLCGLELSDVKKKVFKNYTVDRAEFWPWNLAPASGKRNGIVCRVDAWELVR